VFDSDASNKAIIREHAATLAKIAVAGTMGAKAAA